MSGFPNNLGRCYFKITPTDGGAAWFASSRLDGTPEATLARVKRIAERRGLPVTYELATWEEYAAYFDRRTPLAAPEGGNT